MKQSIKSGKIQRPFFIKSICYLGQKYHRVNIKITRNLNNVGGTDNYIKPLSEEKALDSGAEFLGEFIGYGTLFVWGIYEVNKLSKDGKEKEKVIADNITRAHTKIDGVEENYKKLLSEVEKLRNELSRLNTEKSEKLSDSTENA